jgi:uncharacterized protein YgiM (DUF1202 family)
MKRLIPCFIVVCLLGITLLPDLSMAKRPIPPPPPPGPIVIVPPPPPPAVSPPSPPPPGPIIIVPPMAPQTGRAAVTPDVLNVRSGPGMNYPIVGHVFKGTVLEIQGNAPGWLYVVLPAGNFGWVSMPLTVPVPSAPPPPLPPPSPQG